MIDCDAIARFLGSERLRQEAFLAALVRVASDNPPGNCTPHAEHAARLLEGLGFSVERHPVSQALVDANGMRSVTNLVVRQRFGANGPVIALNAHGDVVPPGAGWTRDPYGSEIVDGWMYGRGAAVSKSDFATYAWALLALKVLKKPLRGSVELHFTYDEEAGGEIGPALLLREGISSPDLAIGAGFSYAVGTAHNGCLHLEVTVHGRSAHAALPGTGLDALEAATAILTSLYQDRVRLAELRSAVPGIGSPKLTVGLIEGGTNTNVVPDRVRFRLDRRIIPEENPAVVEHDLGEKIAAAASSFPDVRIELRRILLATPLVPLAGGARLAEILCGHASRVMGQPVATTGVPLYTDARHYAACGVPVVLYGAGPHTIEEANAHRADERVPLADLHKATEVVALTLATLLDAT